MSADQPVSTSTSQVTLLEWGQEIDRALRGREASRAASMAQTVLRQRPRHLATYQRLVEAAWQLQRWDEAADWGQRLLQADPGNGRAWRAVAQGLEQKEKRAEAHVAWQRAFECAPYNADIRAGLNRTNLAGTDPLRLNQACLAQLHLRCYHWRQAAAVYGELVKNNPDRSDYLVALAVALWRLDQRSDAYRAARFAVHSFPNVLITWAVVAGLGDENDRALAQHPVMNMDPDGEYVRRRLRLENAPAHEHKSLPSVRMPAAMLDISASEARFLPGP